VEIRVEQLQLRLVTPFKIAHGSTSARYNVLAHVSDGQHSGVGEAAVVPYYGETAERVTAWLTRPDVRAALGANPLLLEDALNALPPADSPAALAALDMALHDLWGQRLGHPLYRLWGLNPARCPVSSLTVSMADDEQAYRNLLRAVQRAPLVKLKLGSGDVQRDLELAQIARAELPGTRLCADANSAWTAEQSLWIIPRLAELAVAFVEQPVARADYAGWRALRAGLPAGMPPVIADESSQNAADIAPLAGLADGVNIKLAKCGGLRAARQMIALARAFGMRVMLGCMVESSVAVTAAAHLAPLADYADLDSSLLISNDPYQGVVNADGRLILPDAPGLGLRRRIWG